MFARYICVVEPRPSVCCAGRDHGSRTRSLRSLSDCEKLCGFQMLCYVAMAHLRRYTCSCPKSIMETAMLAGRSEEGREGGK